MKYIKKLLGILLIGWGFILIIASISFIFEKNSKVSDIIAGVFIFLIFGILPLLLGVYFFKGSFNILSNKKSYEKMVYPDYLPKPSFFYRIFGVLPKKYALLELQHYLNEQGIHNAKVEDIIAIEDRYKIRFLKSFKKEIFKIYKANLEKYLSDRKLDNDEIENLNKLKSIFKLNDNDVKKITDEVSMKIYQEEVAKALQDGKLDSKEKMFLEKIKKELQLPDDIANNIYRESATVIINNFIKNAISDERLSPDEEKTLNEIAKNLNVNIEFDDKTKVLLEKYKLFWRIENGDMPIVDVSISLPKNEYCHFITDAEWWEQRKVTKGYNYSGPSLRIKIAKGLYWRVGSIAVKSIQQDEYVLIDVGKLFLTNKRLIFIGAKGSKSIKLNNILDFTPYKNGIDIQKDKGRNPFISFNDNVDIFVMILGKLISNI
ncbi:MAG: hypothetical protein WBK20_01430 [Spirochaetota bacterium]